MVNTTLRRTAATVGVLAGLLAAAAPASAQSLPGMMGVTAPMTASTVAGTAIPGPWDAVKAPRPSEIYDHGITQARNLNDVEGIDFNALGSEGVKAPRSSASSEEPVETISFNYLKAAGTETGNPER